MRGGFEAPHLPGGRELSTGETAVGVPSDPRRWFLLRGSWPLEGRGTIFILDACRSASVPRQKAKEDSSVLSMACARAPSRGESCGWLAMAPELGGADGPLDF